MNFEHLKVFYTVATKRNFSESAKNLHLSQPSVSSQIKQLEASLGVVLFNRSTKKVYLTPEGELLFRHTDQILKLVNQTKNEIALMSEKMNGNLEIGASLTIAEHILPRLLGFYKQQFPQVKVHLKVYNSEIIVEKLLNEEINLGFIESMVNYPHLNQAAFMDDELVLIASRSFCDDKIGHKDQISPEELFSLPLILRERGSGTRQVIEEKLIQNQLNPENLNVILELESTESIKSAVEAGLGVSLISKSAISKELKLNTLKELSISGIHLSRNFFSLYQERNLTAVSDSFLTFIKSYF
ncbi:selenium metabolism-associated LysR family transcriptional regulator [Gracilibacillus sp. D59]|uniref:selenium metabolism-associated LysR family transcriptional regulator n=1 Tax=Gracilibacillus sp. D59 TaxID=3457434 RepID=UPI003FCD21CB